MHKIQENENSNRNCIVFQVWTSPQYADVIVQQPLAVASSAQRALRPAMHILNKFFDFDITLLASFFTAVEYSSSYEPTVLSFLLIFVHLLWLSNNTQKVEWQAILR